VASSIVACQNLTVADVACLATPGTQLSSAAIRGCLRIGLPRQRVARHRQGSLNKGHENTTHPPLGRCPMLAKALHDPVAL